MCSRFANTVLLLHISKQSASMPLFPLDQSSSNWPEWAVRVQTQTDTQTHTVQRTLLHSQLACNEMQASARTCGRRAADSMIENLGQSQVKSVYFNHPSQGNSSNYYLILGPRDKAAPPTSRQINKFPPKREKNLATPSFIFIFISSSSTRELCSQPIRGNGRRIGRMFPEHVERSFLDPEYSFVAVRRILPTTRTRFAKKSSPS